MIVSVVNANSVQPFIPVVDMAVPSLARVIERGGTQLSVELTTTQTVTLPSDPASVNMVSVFLDGFRMVNQTSDFGKTYSHYNVVGDQLTFKEPVTGKIDIFVDSLFSWTLDKAFYLNVQNVQGAKTKATNPGECFAGTFCEPMILTLPLNGYVRVSNDHKSLIYVPKNAFSGYDTFSYTVITDRGQIANPKCVYVRVGSPSKPR